jgi:PHD/YefM family antitoxin component YafN of YafNO toxin-antitoxin module
MIKLEDILSLTEFHRRSRFHIDRLRESGRPQVLTVNGRAEVIVQHASAYQQMIESLEHAGNSNAWITKARLKRDKENR